MHFLKTYFKITIILQMPQINKRKNADPEFTINNFRVPVEREH
jgi:hypothetical protein